MFEINDTVRIKDLKTLLNKGFLEEKEGLEGVYVSPKFSYVLFKDFQFFNDVCSISEIDEDDKEMPYFLSIGIWVPEFLIEKPKEEKKDDEEAKEEDAPVLEDPVKDEYINKFNRKPFGKLFIKLIKLDPKISEFSATNFNKLKKHELQYIAKLLISNGRPAPEGGIYKKLQKDLAMYCYTETVKL